MAKPLNVRGGRPCHVTAPHKISDLDAAYAANGNAVAGRRVRTATRAGAR
jgi:hypothetical protein